MARDFMSDEMVEEEILRLRMYEKKCKQLEAQGITLEELEEMAGDVYD